MGKYSETRYANMIPTFEPAPLPASEATAAQKSNMRVYETFADLPATSTSKGNTAFVKATNKLYVWNGVGWYLVAEVTNASPSSITGVNSTYGLATDGTATTITAVATDPEGMALTGSSSVTAGSLNGTTVSNVDNVFTVTPHATNATTFTLTFSVTDGVNSAVSYPSSFALSFEYYLTNASYDNVSFSFSSQETDGEGLSFSSSGDKMYIVGSANSTVYEYDLSTNWAVSSASYNNVSFYIGSEETAVVQGITFSSSGDKMYIVGSSDTVYEYDLSTNWDVSSASYNSVNKYLMPQISQARDVEFSSSGDKMYVLNGYQDNVYEYDLSTNWDVSSASYNNVRFYVNSQETNPKGLSFSSSGDKMYIVGVSSVISADSVNEYNLGTNWDLSSAVYNSINFSVTSQTGYPMKVKFSTGNKMYIFDNTTVYQYSL